MIIFKILIEEKGTKYIKSKEASKTNITAKIKISDINATKSEKVIAEQYKDALQLDEKNRIIDNTKNKKFSDLEKLQNELNELLKGIE